MDSLLVQFVTLVSSRNAPSPGESATAEEKKEDASDHASGPLKLSPRTLEVTRVDDRAAFPELAALPVEALRARFAFLQWFNSLLEKVGPITCETPFSPSIAHHTHTT